MAPNKPDIAKLETAAFGNPTDRSAVSALARAYLTQGRTAEAWTLMWWSRAGGSQLRRSPWREVGVELAKKQRPILKTIQGWHQGFQVATRAKQFGTLPWYWEWRRRPISEVLKDEPRPVLAVWSMKKLSRPRLRVICQLDTLLHLNVEDHGVFGDAEAKAISALRGLKHLEIGGTAITDVGLKHLSTLRALVVLSLRSFMTHGGCPKVTDDGLKVFDPPRWLAKLELSNCSGLSDAALEHIGKLTNLRELYLDRIPVTDRGLAHLHDLTLLERLDVGLTGEFTAEGLIRLGKALPLARKTVCHDLYRGWSSGPLWKALDLMHVALLEDCPEHAVAERVSLELLSHFDDQKQAMAAVSPLLILAIDSDDIQHRWTGVYGMGVLATSGDTLTSSLSKLALCLSDNERGIAEGAYQALRKAALAGADLTPVQSTLRATVGSEYGHLAEGILAMHRAREENGSKDLEALAKLHNAWRKNHSLITILMLVEESFKEEQPSQRAEASGVIRAAAARVDDRIVAVTALLPIIEKALRHEKTVLRKRGAFALGGALRHGVTLSQDTLVQLVAMLTDDDEQVARNAAYAISTGVGKGVDLTPVRASLEEALATPRKWVIDPASSALSAFLRRIGEEEELPRGCSHRRIYARSDTPITAKRTCKCRACGSARTVCIHSDGMGGNAGCHYWWEFLCQDCGKYSIDTHETG